MGGGVADAPLQLPNAASALAEAPDAQRERIARLLTEGTPSPLNRRLAGELLLGWGQALRAWAVFEPSVATPSRTLRSRRGASPTSRAPAARPTRAACALSRSRVTPTWRLTEGGGPGAGRRGARVHRGGRSGRRACGARAGRSGLECISRCQRFGSAPS